MKKPIFKGAGVAIVTPMNADGSINYEAFGRLIDFQISEGTDAIIVCGTTGECATLSHEEHIEAIRYTVEKTAKRVPVIAGTGSNDTAFSLELSKQAELIGADALLMVTPYYNKTSQAGIVRHFTYIADRVNVPIIVYNVPSRTGLDIKPETYKELSKHPNIAAAKEANGNITSMVATKALCGDDLVLYSGSDDHIVPVLSVGGMGVISVLSNIMPKAVHELCIKYLNGDTAGSLEIQLRLFRLIRLLFSDVNPVPVKYALNLMGYEAGGCRLPLIEMNAGNASLLKEEMTRLGLLK